MKLLITLLTIATLGIFVSEVFAEDKPDILFIAIDDMNDWTTVFDENNPIKTPNLERLAARGAFFENAESGESNRESKKDLGGANPKKVEESKKGKAKLELYDLSTDLGEKTDLARTHPEIVAELDRLLKEHASGIAANLRPAGFAENPKPILKEVGDIPTLKEYLGK